VASQVPLPVHYREVQIEIEFRIDSLVNELVLIEVKAVERMLAIHEAQLLTYLKLSDKHLGLLINFNVPLIKDGIRRLIG
jgi:GxxExxY protein